jgi:hypothetical protein
MTGCSKEAVPAQTTTPTAEVSTQLANPWKDYVSLEEAEAASGLDFPMPETIADSYVAESFRVMNSQLLEVRYRDGDFPVTVRMQTGEGQDLSGVYGEFENPHTFEVNGATIKVMSIDAGVLQLISKDGYSYSLHAPNDYWGDSNIEFLQYIYDAK